MFINQPGINRVSGVCVHTVCVCIYVLGMCMVYWGVYWCVCTLGGCAPGVCVGGACAYWSVHVHPSSRDQSESVGVCVCMCVHALGACVCMSACVSVQ